MAWGVAAEEACLFFNGASAYSICCQSFFQEIVGRRVAYNISYGSGQVVFAEKLKTVFEKVGIDTNQYTFFDDNQNKYAVSTLRENIVMRQQNNKNSEFTIGVVGPGSSGKTTLVNALLGINLLPVGVVPTTAVITTLKYDMDQKVFLINKEGAKKQIPIETLSYIMSWIEEGSVSDESMREAIVYVPSMFLKNNKIEIIDIPRMYWSNLDKIIKCAYPRFDAAVMVLSSCSCFTETESNYLMDLLEYVDLTRIIFVINKIDLYSNVRDRNRIVEAVETQIRRSLKNINYELADRLCTGDITVLLLSAKEAVKGIGDVSLLRDSGILELKDILCEMISKYSCSQT